VFFTTRSHGAGMGLAVVRRIIDEHASVGATIDVRSGEVPADPGPSGRQGATFEVGLARAPVTATRRPPPVEPRSAPAETQRGVAASDQPVTPGVSAASQSIRPAPEKP
jgi:hypothetical protein